MKHLRKDHPITLVFIDATDDALLRRYSETRRPHPLGKALSVRESLRHERTLMEPIRKLADLVIDSTQFNVHELRTFVTERFKNPDTRPMLVSVVSFGYKYGVPSDSDLVFDVRAPNPHFVRAAPLHRPGSQSPKYIRRFLNREFLRRIEPSRLSDSTLHQRRVLFHDCLRLYRGKYCSVMLAARRKTREARIFHQVVHRDEK